MAQHNYNEERDFLFRIELKNYDNNRKMTIRPSVRSIIVREGKIALIYSKRYNYYKLPGGGIEESESRIMALKRETIEETGLNIIEDSIRFYGLGILMCKGIDGNLFVQHNYYYFCNAEEEIYNTAFQQDEKEEFFVLRWVGALHAITVNRENEHFGKSSELSKVMLERECRILEKLIHDGYC